MRVLLTVLLLIGSNTFMTWAWYGHLKHARWSIPLAIFVSWLIALPEYLLQVPANRLGHVSQGGPLSAPQLKIIQEAVTLGVFLAFTFLVLKERPRLNEYIAFGLIFAGVAVAMIGRGTPADARENSDPRPSTIATAAVDPPTDSLPEKCETNRRPQ